MTDVDAGKKVNVAWEKARGHFHYPALSEPQVVKKMEGGACFNFRTRETLVDETFVARVSRASGLSVDDCLEGIFVHEIGHYMAFPRNLGTLILAGKMTDDFFKDQGEELVHFLVQTYADMANDTYSVLEEQRRDPILKMRNASQEEINDKLNAKVRAVMLAYLHHQAGKPYELPEELKPYLERMITIDFLNDNVEKMRQGIWAFGNIIKDLIEKNCGGAGKVSLKAIDGASDVEIKKILENATPGEIRKALREISDKISRHEFKKVEDWLGKNGVKPHKSSHPPILTIGTSEGELQVDREVVEYYRELSKNYPIVVSRKLLETDSVVHSYSDIQKWRPGVDPSLALPGTSGGRFLPGITRSVKIRDIPVRTTDYKTPHLLVIRDSSGSMGDPKEIKCYTTLGANCAARSYHLQGSFVGVINFSGSSFYLPYTRDLDVALGAIDAYQGGGTVVDVEMVRKMLGPEMAELYRNHPDRSLRNLPKEYLKKEISVGVPDDVFKAESIDVIMFTDGGIANLNEVLGLFAEKAQLNRATIVLTGGFAQELDDNIDPRIKVHRIESEKDIPKLIIDEVRRNLAHFVEGLRR